MEIRQHFSLRNYNSFNVKAVSSTIYFPQTDADLMEIPNLSERDFYILGEGSNSLFVDEQAPIIIKPDFKGINITETHDNYIVTVGASENWHELVCSCLESNIYGLENLALIPGSVGAAPVQNIGAYGVEFSDFCSSVKWFEFSSKTIKTLSNEDCEFSYRESIFKQALYNMGVITEVVFRFPKNWQANLSYAGLKELGENVTAKQIMNKVISLRQSKLPDPKILPNAGSFFKNPIVNQQTLDLLKDKYPTMPYYPQENGQAKLAAGWLIEQAGLKGYSNDGVGVHELQALVLVNYENDSGATLVALARLVQQKIIAKFNVLITPEVRMVTKCGERPFSDLQNV